MSGLPRTIQKMYILIQYILFMLYIPIILCIYDNLKKNVFLFPKININVNILSKILKMFSVISCYMLLCNTNINIIFKTNKMPYLFYKQFDNVTEKLRF